MEEVTLVAEAGRPTGSGAARRLRRAGRVPAVLYGHGIEPVSLSVDGRALRRALTTDAGVNALITLEVNGRRHLAMARQLQRDPLRGSVRHVDFLVVRRDEVVSAQVPIQLTAEAQSLTSAGGVLDQVLFALSIAARPGDIPPSIDIDVSGLRPGDTVKVGDLELPPGVATEADSEELVLSAQAPQAAETPEGAEAEVAEREAAGAEGLPATAPEGEASSATEG